MITSIRLEEFKGHRDTTVPLVRFTVLVGPNGSGKTSVLEALWLQSQIAERGSREVLTGDWALNDLSRRGASVAMAISLTSPDAGIGIVRLEISKESLALVTRGVTGRELAVSGWTPFPTRPEAPSIADFMGPTAFFKLNAEPIAAAAYSDEPGTAIARDGTNTAVALAELKLGFDEDFSRIEQELRSIVPSVERVRIRPATVRRRRRDAQAAFEELVGSKIYFDFIGAPGVPAHGASQGTLITLALLTILHSPKRPRILLLDDFDQSLHPQAQIELVRLLKRLLDQISDLQIVATTHSPYVLDEIDPSNVLAFALRSDGTTAVKKLSEHPDAAKMKSALTAGQLWSLDAEQDWVLKDNPA